jgi:ABC-2 type transport system permease protein
MTPAPAFPPPRVAADFSHAFGGVWRLTFRRFLLPGSLVPLAIALALLALLGFAQTRGGQRTDHYVEWLVRFYATFLTPALAFLAAGGALRDEMKSGTVDYVLTRPVPRPAFVAFKFLAHTACVQLQFVVALAVALGVGMAFGVPGLAAAWPRLLFAQALLIAAFGALGMFCAALTTRYFVIGLAYAAVVEVGVGSIPTQLSRLSMTHQVRNFLAPLFDAANAADAPGWIITGAILIVFTTVMVAATGALFAVRELSGPADA